MSVSREQWTDKLATEQETGWAENFLADEERFDRRTLWRLGALGVGTVAAIVVAVLAQQSVGAGTRPAAMSADFPTQQARQIERITAETQAEFNRMALTLDQLMSDRDKLQVRLSALELTTGSLRSALAGLAPGHIQTAVQIYQQSPNLSAFPAMTAASAPPPEPAKPAVPTVIAAAEPAPITPAAPSPVQMVEPAATAVAPAEAEPAPAPEASAAPPETTGSIAPAELALSTPVNQTRFGLDLGAANSMEGLRALWRGLIKTDPALAELQPILIVRERANGLGMQLRLVAGPFDDAAEAARRCVAWSERKRACETVVYEGQRLSLKAAAVAKPAAPASPVVVLTPPPPPMPPVRRRTSAVVPEPTVITAAPDEAAAAQGQAPPRATLGSLLGIKLQ